MLCILFILCVLLEYEHYIYIERLSKNPTNHNTPFIHIYMGPVGQKEFARTTGNNRNKYNSEEFSMVLHTQQHSQQHIQHLLLIRPFKLGVDGQQ